MRAVLCCLVAAACGDNLAPAGRFEIVGHSDLEARGMNSAIAVAGDIVYVGSRIDKQDVLIVDVADRANPHVVGRIPGVPGMSSRELRAVADQNLLVILNLQCSAQLHGCGGGAPEGENLKIYDISDRVQPVLLGTYTIKQPSLFAQRSPHEFFLWRDPKEASRVLVMLTAPPAAPQFEIIDVSAPVPTQVAAWDPIRDGGLPSGGTGDNILHSVSASADGRVGYFSHQTDGLVLVDLSQIVDRTGTAISLITPPAQALDWAPPGVGPHSAVKVPGRDLLVVSEEIYPLPFGGGCPWGHVRLVDISDPTRPVKASEYKIAENTAGCANVPPSTAFTAHNATVTHDLALVTWYAGGLQAVDISDAAAPFQLAEFRPEPLATVTKEDPGLGGNPVEMWSYPVIQDGLVYVVDVRNGLYILRYHGRWGEQLREQRFLEGNSNL